MVCIITRSLSNPVLRDFSQQDERFAGTALRSTRMPPSQDEGIIFCAQIPWPLRRAMPSPSGTLLGHFGNRPLGNCQNYDRNSFIYNNLHQFSLHGTRPAAKSGDESNVTRLLQITYSKPAHDGTRRWGDVCPISSHLSHRGSTLFTTGRAAGILFSPLCFLFSTLYSLLHPGERTWSRICLRIRGVELASPLWR